MVEIRTKLQFTATGSEPDHNQKLRQFNNVQYCNVHNFDVRSYHSGIFLVQPDKLEYMLL